MCFKISFLISGVLTAGIIVGFFLTPYPKQRTLEDPRVASIAAAMEGLWSADNEERQTSKDRLIQLGQSSELPLIRLLQDLITDRKPVYLRGKEKEASELKRKLESLPEKNDNGHIRVIQELDRLEITWRLKSDICDLLGRLQATAAIPVLIQMMETEDSLGTQERMNPAMYALVAIGPEAIPKVIEAMETAEGRAASTVFGDGHTPSDFYVRTETFKIQARGAIVLGGIGDSRALPALEELLERNANDKLIPYVKEAIEKIRNTK